MSVPDVEGLHIPLEMSPERAAADASTAARLSCSLTFVVCRAGQRPHTSKAGFTSRAIFWKNQFRVRLINAALLTGSTMRHVMRLLLCGVPLVCGAQSTQRVDILRIFEAFIAANAAYTTCGASDPDVQRKFQANYAMVTMRAAQALEEQNPGLTGMELANMMESRMYLLSAVVSEEIKRTGCESPKIRALIELHHKHAEWRP